MMSRQPVQIRKAALNDAELLARLNASVQRLHYEARPDIFKPPELNDEIIAWYAELLKQPENHFFIAEAEGRAVGYVGAKVVRQPATPFTVAMDGVLIDQISVNDDQRGKGYGAALMQAVVDLARTKKINRITLGVWDFNNHAIEFYKRQGWRVYTERMEILVESG
ncbi:MAG: GNAT family N-acetyltransferase [bacterium]|nr:GNAT family N-acetyltransferase [bacterium]